MTRDEKIQLIKLAKEVAAEAGRPDLPITVGSTGQSTKDVIADVVAAHEAGADFTLVLCPSYFHFAMNEDSITGFFTEVVIPCYCTGRTLDMLMSENSLPMRVPYRSSFTTFPGLPLA